MKVLRNALIATGVYLMRITGNLKTDNPNTAADESTNVGPCKAIVGLNPVPVPPALMLRLTAIGAMFGFGRMRRTTAAV